METKRCFKCERVLGRSEFYRHPEMADGLLGKCKDCCKSDVRKNRAERREYYSWYDATRARTPHRRAAAKEQRERHRERRKRHSKDWYDKNRHKKRAHTIVQRAVASGILSKKPCAVCGTRNHVDAHHEDYSKPLDVEWLCRKHHVERHFPPPPEAPPIPKASRWDKKRKQP